MTIDEKKDAYKQIGIPYIGISGNRFFKVVSLLCRMTMAVRKKKAINNLSSYDVIDMFFKPRTEYERLIVENLVVHCDYQLGLEHVEFDDYGIKTAKEAQQEIVHILSDYLPF